MKFRAVLLILFTGILSVFTVVYGGYRYFNFKYDLTETKSDTNVTHSQIKQNKEIASENVSSVKNNNSSKPNTEKKAVTASASGQAKGKIIPCFLTPYSANTSYNNVYIKNRTNAKINIKSLLSSKLSYKIQKNNKPQVLIVHTHTTESYMLEERDYYTENDNTRSRKKSENMIAIGNVIEEKLKEANIGVIHDTTVHDYPSYTGSYTRAAQTIKSDLKAYPSIKIVIDVHRDAIGGSNGNHNKPVVKINGEQVAQVMLVMGSGTGSIKDFPKWKENLKLAVKFQQTMEVMYPGLARSITLNEGRYNENITTGSILLEVGSDANTIFEAKKAAGYAADALVSLLNTVK